MTGTTRGRAVPARLEERIKFPVREDRNGNRVIPLSDGRCIDVRRLLIFILAVRSVYGEPAHSASDLPRIPALDRLFGERDDPVSDDEIVEAVKSLAENDYIPEPERQRLTDFVENRGKKYQMPN